MNMLHLLLIVIKIRGVWTSEVVKINKTDFCPISNCRWETEASDVVCVEVGDNRCDFRDFCKFVIPSKRPMNIRDFKPPCKEGTELTYSEKIKMNVCCPIMSRFYQIFETDGTRSIPVGICNESSPECSCEPMANPSQPFGLDRSMNNLPLKMCYKPEDTPSNIVLESILEPCLTNSDCRHTPDAYCMGEDLYLDVYDATLDRMMHRGGFCVVDRPPLTLPSTLTPFSEFDSFQGKLTVKGTNCIHHFDCLGAGRQMEFQNNSVNYCNLNTSSGKGVCQLFKVRNKPCGNHNSTGPLVFCGTNDFMCSFLRTPKGVAAFCGACGVCCLKNITFPMITYTKGKKQFLCPDTVTDYRREPKCAVFNNSNEKVEMCPVPGGICVKGHCCPSVIYYNKTVNALAKKSYITNRKCARYLMRKSPPVHSFCDEVLERYIVIGTEMDEGEEKTTLPISNRKCKFVHECKAFHAVCVRTFNDGICYHHPSFAKPPANIRTIIFHEFSTRIFALSILSLAVTWVWHSRESNMTLLESLRYLLSITVWSKKTMDELNESREAPARKIPEDIWEYDEERLVNKI